MPFEIKTRSGDVVVLQFSEWVYALVGLCVFSLILSILSLVIVLTHLPDSDSEEKNSTEQEKIEKEDKKLGTVIESPSEPTSNSSEQKDSSEKATFPSSLKEVSSALKVNFSGQLNPLAPQDDGDSEVSLTNTLTLIKETQENESQNSAEDPTEDESAEGSLVSTTQDQTEETHDDPVEEEGPSEPLLLAESSSYFKWFFLAHLRGEIQDSSPNKKVNRLKLVGAFLHDSDTRVRSRALHIMDHWVDQNEFDSEGWQSVASLIQASESWLGNSRMAKKLIAHIGGSQEISSDSLPWDQLNALAHQFIQADSPLADLFQFSKESVLSPLDIVLAIDVSQSMKTPYDTLKLEIGNLYRELSWVFPEVRVGALLYRDEIVKVIEFGSSPTEFISGFDEIQAEGGGDVPEGVYEAIKGALELGRFPWRPDASKQIVVIGDVSCPYEKKQALNSLARGARRDAQFTIHTLGISPEAGFDHIPGFPQLAAAGGGESKTLEPKDLVPTLRSLFFPASTRSLVEASQAAGWP